VREVAVTPARTDELASVLLPEGARELLELAELAKEVFAGRVIWNVSSTAGGGGVAEMLARFVRYVQGAGVDCRWVVIEGDAPFFELTKRIHNNLHDEPGDGGPLGDEERAVYERVCEMNSGPLLELVGPRDVVILHDPQPAGLAVPLRDAGVPVIWRCHVGVDEHSEVTERAWAFLRPWIEHADATVFSRRSYAPSWIDPDRMAVIEPAIDPLSRKNQPLEDDVVSAILGRAGVLATNAEGAGFTDADGGWHPLEYETDVVREGGPLDPGVPVITQVSRWDRLKDMHGVLRGFVEGGVGRATGSHLLLVGPDVKGVTDDPEGQVVLEECIALWRGLGADERATVSLVSVPMGDLEQNALIVNALQRHAAVVAQKSLREGFGLTVAEAMWKGRAVLASAVGGIQDQVRDGQDGILLPDPRDLGAFAEAARALLGDPDRARRMGESGHERVRDYFLADRDLSQWMALLDGLSLA
jgi:trehalose synthase